MDKTLWKFKVANFKNRTKEKFDDACDDIRVWWDKNRDWAIVVIPAVFALSTRVLMIIAKVVSARTKAKQMDIYYNSQIYDPRSGVRLNTKRPMTAEDKKNFAALRTECGMSVRDSLMYLDLL